MHPLPPLFILISTPISSFLLAVLFFQTRSAMNGQTRKHISTDAEAEHPWVQEARRVVSRRGAGPGRREGWFRGRGRMRIERLIISLKAVYQNMIKF